MKVVRINNVSWDNNPSALASMDVETSEGFIIRDCILKTGEWGLYVSMPAKPVKTYNHPQTGKPTSYKSTVFIPKQAMEELKRICEDTYNPDGNYPKALQSSSKQNTEGGMATGTIDDVQQAHQNIHSDDGVDVLNG